VLDQDVHEMCGGLGCGPQGSERAYNRCNHILFGAPWEKTRSDELCADRARAFPVNECEILIVLDKAAVKKGTDWYRSLLSNVRIVTVPASTYYKSRNAALTHATREFIAFAASDVAYQPGWLAELVQCLSERDGIAAGITHFDQGFLSQTLDVCDWSATRPSCGWTDWFFGNNFAARRNLSLTYGFT
jgi:hypothetical protein